MTPTSYDIKARIGVILQNVAVFDELNVYENIDCFCGLYIKDKAIRKKYVDEAIEFVGLNDFTKFKPKKLSGGLLTLPAVSHTSRSLSSWMSQRLPLIRRAETRYLRV